MGSRRSVVTLGTRCPTAIRATLLEKIRRAADAPAAGFYAIGTLDGRPRVTSMQHVGERWLGEVFEAMRAEAPNWPSSTLAQFRSPPRHHTRTFLEVDAIADRREFEKTEFWRNVWSRHDVSDQIRLLVVHGNRLLGWVGAAARGSHRYTRRDRKRLAPLVETSVNALAAAAALERADLPEREAFIVARADGSLEHASANAAPWFDRPDFHGALATTIRGIDAGNEAETFAVIELAAARIVRLDDEARPAYLVCVRPAPLPMVAPNLSPAVRRVAEAAATGATAGQIACTLGISVNTVRAQLKAAYRALGVKNRVELTRALASG